MLHGRHRTLILLLPILVFGAASAGAQDSTVGGAALGGVPGTTTASTPAPTSLAPTTVIPSTPVPAPAAQQAGGPSTSTPTPPPYLTAGSGAQQIPTVATVGNLEKPVIPISIVRLAAIASAVLCLLLLAWAGLLRTLGLRTAAQSPALAVAPPGRLGRLTDRARLIADDVRDFLSRRR